MKAGDVLVLQVGLCDSVSCRVRRRDRRPTTQSNCNDRILSLQSLQTVSENMNPTIIAVHFRA